MVKVPVTIITGYLGAGKTTLLRKIAQQSGRKIAILMNEFGDIAIDSKIIEGKNINMTELAGGCVCCSLSGEFEAAMAEILQKIKPEWIVVETTGVAEPAALAHDVVENVPGVKLDAIVTLVDCDSLIRYPNLGHTGREQIELADILILNKTDLISKTQLEEIKSGIKKINERATMIETIQSEVDMKIIFGIERTEPIVLHKAHKVEFDYVDFVTDKKIDHGKFLVVLQNLPQKVYRSKGFVVTNQGNLLMNYVAGRFNLEEFECSKTELIFIGKGLDAKKLQKMIEECII